MGRLFRNTITSAQYQRSFHKDELLQLLAKYGAAMGPEYVEKRTIEGIKNKILRHPDLPRKTVLESCTVRGKIRKKIRAHVANHDARMPARI